MIASADCLLHFLLVSFPAQGHVNPLLRLAKRLASKGLLVSFAVPERVGKQMTSSNNIPHLQSIPIGDGFIRFEFFQDGFQEDDPRLNDGDLYIDQLELVGKQAIPEIIRRNNEQGSPVSCLINNPFIPWVSDVAEDLGLPSAMFWIQSCASFSSYYHHYHKLVPFPTEENPEIDVELPFMPVLKSDEVPSFLHPSNPFSVLTRAILSQFRNLEKPVCILMETFQELEDDLIDYMSKLCPIKPIGPLCKDPESPSHSDVKGDFLKADDCIGWLDEKPPSSVVYISFGSVVNLNQQQGTEIAYGLLDSDVSFLWVLRKPAKGLGMEPVVLPDEFLEKVGDKGKVVQWSPQEKVLAHQSVACFLTHCGWNSTLEALSSGVPVICSPQWGDQVTDAKYLVDVFKVGVRMCRGMAENRSITRDEVKKCLLEATVGPKATEIKENAMKWKVAAEAAVAKGGSSDMNLQAFVDEIKRTTAG